MTHTEQDLRAAISSARVRACKVGSLSSLWDVIFDSEAFLEGRETIIKGTREEVLQKLIAMLEPRP